MNLKNVLKVIIRLIPLMVLLITFSCKSRREITVQELQDHIRYLSSDSLRGRLAGSPGDSLAAEYIKNELSSYGLIPLSGDGFQRLKVTTRVTPGPGNSLSLDGNTFVPDKDFRPSGFSSNAGIESEVIFAGYGLNISIDSLKWNDYQDINVKNKWVMILKGDPESEKSVSPFIPFSGDRDKALSAKDMGAAGVLLVSGPVFDQQDAFEPHDTEEMSVGIPVIRIKREVADLILNKRHESVARLENKLNDTRKPYGFATGKVIRGRSDVTREMRSTRNVVMKLPGEDDSLRNEYIIIGAHLDHLGMGGPGSGSRAVDTVAIHHGADDNASGVSLMLELAEKFAYSRGTHKRSIICIAFAAEEEGLIGSRYFVDNPGIDLSKVNAMINLDMVGKLQPTNVLQISGAGTAEGLKDLIIAECDTGLIKLTISDEGYGPSDHTSFYGKNIPVLFFTTGADLTYHTPGDTFDKINYPGIVRVSSLIFNIAEKLASSHDRLKFREAGPRGGQERQMRRRGPSLGIMPDYAGNIKNGLRADFVSPGRPAALGGMKAGDIITSINGKSVNNIYDYMSRMGQLKHGQTISVEVLRENKRLVLLIQL